ncbi:unnamed protein product, partial [Ectocarpus sp. 13 AM-2016]
PFFSSLPHLPPLASPYHSRGSSGGGGGATGAGGSAVSSAAAAATAAAASAAPDANNDLPPPAPSSYSAELAELVKLYCGRCQEASSRLRAAVSDREALSASTMSYLRSGGGLEGGGGSGGGAGSVESTRGRAAAAAGKVAVAGAAGTPAWKAGRGAVSWGGDGEQAGGTGTQRHGCCARCSEEALCLSLEVVYSLLEWPGSARLLRETGLLEQLLRIHASETVGYPSVSTARAVLIGIGLRDLESAKRVRDEILSKVAFVLPRHQGLDVRGLLQQDLLLLRALCLSPAGGGGGGGGGGEEESEGTETVACWRLHVGLLLEILRRMPAAADASLAMVKHVVLPCLDTVAALCLDGVDYPNLRKKEEAPPAPDGDEQHHGAAASDGGGSGASPSVSDVEVATPASDGGRVEDVVLGEVLRASADAGTLSSASATTTGGGGFCCRVGWVTPAQAQNALAATAAAAAAESALDGGGGSRQPRFSSFPEHWLLRLMASKQSPVLRTFSGMVLGAMAAFKGPRRSKEVAEVAAHMVGVVGADGSEAAGLQTLSLLGRLCSGVPTNRETQAYMEQRGLGDFLAAAVLLETRRLQDQSNAAARPPPPFFFGGPADAATAPPEAPRTGELLLRLAEALGAVDAASSSSSSVAMVDGDEWKLLMPAEGAPTTAAETGGSVSDATASGHAAGDNEGASSSPPAAGEKAAATDGSAAAAAAAAARKGTAERRLDHVLEAMVRARGIAMPHS